MNPSSFCCISTLGSSKELIGMLLTLSIHNKNAKVYIMTDTPTKNKIEDLQKYIELDIDNKWKKKKYGLIFKCKKQRLLDIV